MKTLLIAAIVLALGGSHYMAYHAGTLAQAVDLSKEKDANDSNGKTITALKMSLAQCETNQTVDQFAQAKALKDREAVAAKAKDTYEAALRALKQTMSSDECKQWAKEAACGSFP